MEVTTRFNIGDNLSVIDSHKIIDFKVKGIEITAEGICYRSENYRSYPEDVCFASRQEVVNYIIGNTIKSETSKS